MSRKIRNTQNLTPTQGLGIVQDIFEAMEKAKFSHPDSIAQNASIGFQCALLSGKYGLAAKYIKQSYEATRIVQGDNSPTTKLFLNLMKNPPEQLDYIYGVGKYVGVKDTICLYILIPTISCCFTCLPTAKYITLKFKHSLNFLTTSSL